jgi:hypothetical protein
MVVIELDESLEQDHFDSDAGCDENWDDDEGDAAVVVETHSLKRPRPDFQNEDSQNDDGAANEEEQGCVQEVQSDSGPPIKRLCLGIDPGTTGLGVCWIDPETNTCRFQRDDLFAGNSSKRKRELANRVRAWIEKNRERFEYTAVVSIEELVVANPNASVACIASLLEMGIRFMFPDIHVFQENPKDVRRYFGIESESGDNLTYGERKDRSIDIFTENKYVSTYSLMNLDKHFTFKGKKRVDQVEAFLLAIYARARFEQKKLAPTYTLKPMMDSRMYQCQYTPCPTDAKDEVANDDPEDILRRKVKRQEFLKKRKEDRKKAKAAARKAAGLEYEEDSKKKKKPTKKRAPRKKPSADPAKKKTAQKGRKAKTVEIESDSSSSLSDGDFLFSDSEAEEHDDDSTVSAKSEKKSAPKKITPEKLYAKLEELQTKAIDLTEDIKQNRIKSDFGLNSELDGEGYDFENEMMASESDDQDSNKIATPLLNVVDQRILNGVAKAVPSSGLIRRPQLAPKKYVRVEDEYDFNDPEFDDSDDDDFEDL